MSEEGGDTKTAGAALWVSGVVAVGVLAVSIYAMLNTGTGPSEEDLAAVVAPEPAAPAPATDPEPAPEAEVATDAQDEVAPTDQAAETEAVPDPAPAVVPTVDEVRLEADGLTVIAGRAEPGASVSVRVDGAEVATAVADASGAFAAVGFVAPSDAARVLTLEAKGAGAAIVSDADVILAPISPQVAEVTPAPEDDGQRDVADAGGPKPVDDEPVDNEPVASEPATPEDIEPAETDLAEAAPDADAVVDQDEIAALDPETSTDPPAPSTASPKPEGSAAGDVPETADAETEATAETPAEPAPSQSVAVLKSTEEGVELLQPAPEVMTSVAIDTIGYSDAGDVQLSGRAVAGTSEVRVYLDNRFTAALPVDTDGGWRGSIPEIDAGIYQLRVDEVNNAGDVTSRIETPFKREAPAVLSEADDGSDGPVRAVTVQTGDTLWAIARDRYGEGVLYVKVFEANRRDIRDPDLIYPGQVFDLPVE